MMKAFSFTAANRCASSLFPQTVLAAVLVVLLASCTPARKTGSENPFFEKWRELAKTSRGFSPSAPEYGLDLERMPSDRMPLKAEVPEIVPKPLPSIPVSIKMNDVDVGVLLRALARSADQNIVISEKVSGKTSLFIQQAPWNEVFHSILRTNGLTFAWDGDIIRILTIDDLEVDLKREAQKQDMQLVEPLITRVVPIQYNEAAKLNESIQKMLTRNKEGQARGAILVDEHTNALIVQAIRSDIDRILPLLQALDAPTPQILIEAHIVEATSEVARELGIQWGGLANPQNEGMWIYPGGNSSGVLGNKLSTGGIDPTSGLAFSFPDSFLSAGGLGLGLAFEDIGESLLTIQLNALQQEGKLNILSSPSITTLDNLSAVIESGDQVPVQSVSKEGEIEIEYKKAVLSLEVTPHVIQGNTLKLKIVTSKDELDFSRTVAGNPTIVTKKAATNVVLFDGQTTVIGGLNKERTNNSKVGVPGLIDIPVVNWLFSGKATDDQFDNLLIFITPHILEERPAAIHRQKPTNSLSTPGAPLKNGVGDSLNDTESLPDLPPSTAPGDDRPGNLSHAVRFDLRAFARSLWNISTYSI